MKFSVTKCFKWTKFLSLLLILPGLIGFIGALFGAPFFNFDIDFTGGTTIQVAIHTEATQSVCNEISDLVNKTVGIKPASVQSTGNGSVKDEVIIKTSELTDDQANAVYLALEEKYNLKQEDDLLSVDNVSPTIGKDLQRVAVTASIVAAIGILIYISFRFDFRSGLSAIACLLHDVLIILSFYVIFRFPMNINFIAAALTIVGYSINATIVIFDRVREESRLVRKESFDYVVDKSVWASMGRSINTTFTTLVMIVLLLVMGVPSIKNFMIPLLIGVLCGAYSSVFIASPLWSTFRKWFPKH